MAKKNVWKYTDNKDRILLNIKIDQKTSCWEWSLHRDRYGYGQATFNERTMTAHRMSYLFFNGEIQDGLCVCHSCDNRGCVNPTHLFLGTPADNNADMKAKGRYVHHRGERSPGARLTDAEAAEILSLAQKGEMTQKEIGKIYGVGHTTVSAIFVGDNWGHLERG